MSASLPPDPISDMAALAGNLHEIYVSLIAAGFTEQQAIQVIARMLVSGS